MEELLCICVIIQTNKIGRKLNNVQLVNSNVVSVYHISLWRLINGDVLITTFTNFNSLDH
jgi:hypothetical protein